jgi:histidyl-tRNA synthetase
MKAQMKLADRSGARVALIVGPEELRTETVLLRPLRGGADQRSVKAADVVAAVHEEAVHEERAKKDGT